MFSIRGLLIEKLKRVGLRRSERSVVVAGAPRLPGQICLLAVDTRASAHPDGPSSGPLGGPKEDNVRGCF